MAAVMFTDVVGSTELRARLGEESADLLRRDHDSLVASVVHDWQGRVVKGGGDGVMATFDSASDAVGAAVAVQRALRGYSVRPDAVAAIQVRIGISVGDVSLEDGDLFGVPVVEAARLEAAAQPDEILCSQMVEVLSHGRGGHEFEPVGDLELKGLPGPLVASRVLWTPPDSDDGDGRVGLPGRLQPASSEFEFVGRTAELRVLRGAWSGAVTRGPAMVLVGGEPGMGKTRLVAEMTRTAHDEDALVLFSGHDEELLAPLRGICEALRPLIRAVDDQELGRLCAGAEAVLATVLAEIGQRLEVTPAPSLGHGDADAQRARSALVGALQRVAETQPTILVLDDLQWAPLETLRLVREVMTGGATAPLLLIATHRSHELGDGIRSLIADAARWPGCQQILVDGLDRADVAALAEGVESEAVAAVVERTGGNAFLVTELVRAADREGSLGVQLPSAIADSLRGRIDRLSPEVVSTLEAAAVLGQRFDYRTLRAVCGTAIDVEAALDVATTSALVVEDQGTALGYRFAHALAREAVLSGVSQIRRVRLHGAAAEALEASRHRGTQLLSEIAGHRLAAAAGGDAEDAFAPVRAAGAALLDEGGFEQAARLFENAGEVAADLGDERLAAALELRACEATNAIAPLDVRDRFLTLAELAHHRDWTDLLVGAALAVGGLAASWDQSSDPRPRRVLELALTESADSASPQQQALLMARRAIFGVFSDSLADRRRLVAGAMSLFDSAWDPYTKFNILFAASSALISLRSAEECRSLTSQMVEECADDIAPVLRPLVVSSPLQPAAWFGDRAEFDSCADRVQQDDALDNSPFSWAAFYPHIRAMLEGDLVTGRALLDNLDRRREAVASHTFQWHDHANHCLLAWLENSPPSCRSALDRALRDLGGPYFRLWESWWQAITGNPAAAARPLDWISIENLERTFETAGSVGISVPLALATVAVGEPAPLETAYEWLASIPHLNAAGGAFTGPANRWSLATVAVALDRPTQAREAFEQAHQLHRQFDNRIYLALGLIDHASLEASQGNTARAQELLNEAHDTATSGNMPPIAQRLDEITQRLRT